VTIDGQELLRSLAHVPGGRELLAVAAETEFAGLEPELVGGAVRDLVLGRAPRELDVVVNVGAQPFLDALAAAVGGPSDGDSPAGETSSPASPVEQTFHERFLTGSLSWPAATIDVATRRAESYPAPGALPEVREGTPEEDLHRRDFTVNAISLSLAGPDRGRVSAVDHAFEDLREGRLRVLHEESFIEDPTRLLRLGRYLARLNFALEPHTQALAGQALVEGALKTVSGGRVGAELRLALREEHAVAAMAALDELGVLKALDSRLAFDAPVAPEAVSLLRDSIARAEARQELVLLAIILVPMLIVVDGELETAARQLLDWLEFPAADRELAIQAAIGVECYGDELSHARSPAQVYEAVSHVSLESVALAGAWGDEHGWQASIEAGQWLDDLRHRRLRITGKDLIDAGIPEGPHIGRALEEVMAERLDEELPDEPRAQLEAALEFARRELALSQ
jgi:tRNA nucleotidyltransferase (CCA-adding enzyme)